MHTKLTGGHDGGTRAWHFREIQWNMKVGRVPSQSSNHAIANDMMDFKSVDTKASTSIPSPTRDLENAPRPQSHWPSSHLLCFVAQPARGLC
jgi:hypothetical protein